MRQSQAPSLGNQKQAIISKQALGFKPLLDSPSLINTSSCPSKDLEAYLHLRSSQETLSKQYNFKDMDDLDSYNLRQSDSPPQRENDKPSKPSPKKSVERVAPTKHKQSTTRQNVHK